MDNEFQTIISIQNQSIKITVYNLKTVKKREVEIGFPNHFENHSEAIQENQHVISHKIDELTKSLIQD